MQNKIKKMIMDLQLIKINNKYDIKEIQHKLDLIQKNIYKNNGIFWSKNKDLRLCNEIKTMSIKEIAFIHKRTYGAIISRLKKLNIGIKN